MVLEVFEFPFVDYLSAIFKWFQLDRNPIKWLGDVRCSHLRQYMTYRLVLKLISCGSLCTGNISALETERVFKHSRTL